MLSSAGALSRATLLGTVAQLDDKELADVRSRFAVAHRGCTGVDAVQDSDVYFRLNVDRVFYVGGLGSVRPLVVCFGWHTRAPSCPI